MFSPKLIQPKPLDTKRRNLIKLALFGGGAFILGKVIGPSFNLFPKESSVTNSDGKETFFDNFRVNENGDELGIYDKLGNEILIIEKD